jgi:signal transduction histidine kinase
MTQPGPVNDQESRRDSLSAVRDFIVELSQGLARERIQPAVRYALNDPSIEMVYLNSLLDGSDQAAGYRNEVPVVGVERRVRVLGDPRKPLAAMIYNPDQGGEPLLMDIVAAALGVTLENASLRARVARRAKFGPFFEPLVARLVQAADEERRKVERNLHDGAQQQLVTVLLSLQLAKAEAVRNFDSTVAALLEESILALQASLSELRDLARGIHPPLLTEAGLMPAVKSLADRCPIPTDVTGDIGPLRLPSAVETTLYFVVAEAITNAVKHSGGGQINVAMSRGSGLVTVAVSDNGGGGADLTTGSGLRGLSDRVAALSGRLQVDSNTAGTTVRAVVPCA